MPFWRRTLLRVVAVAAGVALPGAASVAGGTTASEYHSHARPIQAVAGFSPAGVMATGDSAGVVHLWRLAEAASKPPGAILRQEGAGIGAPPAEPLPGPVAALAFANARCNGADSPVEAGCGLLVAGPSNPGFSYIRLYDWRRQRLLAAADVLEGRITQLAASPAGETIAACVAGAGIRPYRLDPMRLRLERGTAMAAGAGCDWLGFGPDGSLRYAAGGQLYDLPPATGERPAVARLLDAGPQTAFAFDPAADAPFSAAVARTGRFEIHRTLPGGQDGSPAVAPDTTGAFGRTGAEAVAWAPTVDGTAWFAVGPAARDRATAQVTHRLERWRFQAEPGGGVKASRSNFSELLALQGRALALFPLQASWLPPSDPQRYRFVAVLDAAHRLVLAKATGGGYTRTDDGRYTTDPAFVLEAAPYARSELRVSADGRDACLWTGGDRPPVAFREDGLGPAPCARQPPTRPADATAPVRMADGGLIIPPATRPLDFPADRLRAFALSDDGRSLFAAVAEEPRGEGQDSAEPGGADEVRRYALRVDRWAAVGAPLSAAGSVVALGLSDTATLGVATREQGKDGTVYSVQALAVDAPDVAPSLILHGFAPDPKRKTDFELCFDLDDIATPLALHQKDGPRFRLGSLASILTAETVRPGDARAVSAGVAGAAGAAGAAGGPAQQADIVAAQADAACTEAALTPGLQRFRMTVRLPYAPEGVFDLVPEGGRPEYRIINFSRPKLYVLAVGIDDYYDDRWRLHYAVQDARAFGKLVTETQDQIYSAIDFTILRDAEASRKAILVELAKLQRKATERDWVMIFFAGHAKSDWVYNYYFLPWDYDHAYPHATQISEHDLAAHLGGIKGKKVLVMDTCYAGNLATAPIRSVGEGGEKRRLPLRDVRTYAERLVALDPGLILFAGSSIDQTARESDRLGHGVFTSTLLKALGEPGRFANRRYSGALTVLDIRDWIETEVTRQSEDRQRPVIAGRADLLRAPFWQVSPGSFKGPPMAQARSVEDAADPRPGRRLWQAAGQPARRVPVN